MVSYFYFLMMVLGHCHSKIIFIYKIINASFYITIILKSLLKLVVESKFYTSIFLNMSYHYVTYYLFLLYFHYN